MNKKEKLTKVGINWYPGHMEKAKRLILKEYKNIDIVYELIDARIPKSSKIKSFDKIIGNKPKILIMTKKDLTDLNKIDYWIKYYETDNTKVILANLNDKNDIKKIIKETHDLMSTMQAKRIEKGLKPKEIKALVIGIPNVGKSTLINSLAGKRVAQVGNKPGVTKGLSWLKTNAGILLLDTPGILSPKLDNNEVALNLASFSSIKTEILDVNEIATHILRKLIKFYPEKLVTRYEIGDNISIESIYEVIAKSIGAIKNGEVDYERVSNRIINDLKDGYIKGIIFDERED